MATENQDSSGNLAVPVSKGIVFVVGVGISLFHLYTGGFGVVEAYMQRTIHLMSLMALAYITFPTNGKWTAARLHKMEKRRASPVFPDLFSRGFRIS